MQKSEEMQLTNRINNENFTAEKVNQAAESVRQTLTGCHLKASNGAESDTKDKQSATNTALLLSRCFLDYKQPNCLFVFCPTTTATDAQQCKVQVNTVPNVRQSVVGMQPVRHWPFPDCFHCLVPLV